MIEITIQGTPIAQRRPRFTSRGGKKRAYNSQREEAERWVMEARTQLPKGFRPIEGPVALQIRFLMPIPASTTAKRRHSMRVGICPYHEKKPDLDNLEKWVMDCLTLAGVWVDDKQVASKITFKRYSEQPQTIIRVEAL